MMHLKKERTDSSSGQQFLIDIRDNYCDYIPVYTGDGYFVICSTVFPSNIVTSMRVSDSASVFTVEVWAIIKALEKIKNREHPNSLFIQTNFRVSMLYNI